MNLSKSARRMAVAGLGAALALAVAAPPAAAIIIIDTPPATVTASPSTDLVDGQTITLNGSTFPYSQPVAVKQCSQDLTACTTPTVVTTTSNGYLSHETTVRRRIGIESYDCGAAAGTCVIDVQYEGNHHAAASLTFRAPK